MNESVELLFSAQSKHIPPKWVKTREPKDKQLCKLSAPYKEIQCILNPRHLKKSRTILSTSEHCLT